MQLFNSLSQQIETFVAQNDEVKLYVCGITPYDTAHLGHAFVFATFDILVRYLRSQGLRVVYVENVTDIDDPLFERARELGNLAQACLSGLVPDNEMPVARQHIRSMAEFLGLHLDKAPEEPGPTR